MAWFGLIKQFMSQNKLRHFGYKVSYKFGHTVTTSFLYLVNTNRLPNFEYNKVTFPDDVTNR